MTLIVFMLLAFGPLAVDMYHRRDGNVTLKAASAWSAVYVASALLFAVFLFAWRGASDAGLFLSGYAIEKSLSVDNLLVFASIFTYFGVAAKYQYRVLHFGIIGSVILRLAFVSFGIFMFYLFGRVLDIVFGAFVIWTVSKLEKSDGDAPEIDHNKRWYIRWTKLFLPVSANVTDRFFVRSKFGWFDSAPSITPLFLCLVAIEFTDIAFAFDSVPAVIGVTKDTMLAYASIMFAVIGLRSLYFVMEAVMKYMTNLQAAISVVLCYIGLKLIIHGVSGWELPAWLTLLTVALAIVYAAGFSFIRAKPKENQAV